MAGGPQLIIILIVILVLFGGSQLPKLAKNLGKAQKEFRDGLGDGSGSSDTAASDSSAPPTSTNPLPPPSAPPE